MKFRILFVHPSVNRPCGPDNSLFELIKRLDQQRYEIYLLAPRENELTAKFRPYACQIFALPEAFFRSPQTASVGELSRAGRDALVAFVKIYRLIRRQRIDLVHVNVEICWYASLAARAAGAKAVTHIRGLNAIDPGRGAAWIARLLNLSTDRFIAVSQAVADEYTQAGVDARRTQVINNGVDLQYFRRQPSANAFNHLANLPSGSRTLGSVGSADPRKGWLSTIEAYGLLAQKYPDVHCFLVGDTQVGCQPVDSQPYTYIELLQRRVSELGLSGRLHFAGPMSNMPEVYSSLYALIQPSVSEAGPRSVLEALAVGTPVIATDLGGNRSYLADGKTGYLVAPGDAQAIAARTVYLLEHPDVWEQMSRQGRQAAEDQFSVQAYVNQVQLVYQSLLKR